MTTEPPPIAQSNCGVAGNLKTYFCYLLRSKNPRYRSSNYIGFTVNPSRRIRQHNGELTSGAKKTQKKRPWEMVVTVSGFFSQVCALRFEWAWQHPNRSRVVRSALRNVTCKNGSSGGRKTGLRFHMAVLHEMVHIGEWRRIPLRISYLCDDAAALAPLLRTLPDHVQSVRVDLPNLLVHANSETDIDNEIFLNPSEVCLLCSGRGKKCPNMKTAWLQCTHSGCKTKFPVKCLANHFNENNDEKLLVPKSGNCPRCIGDLHWGTMVYNYNRKKKECGGGGESEKHFIILSSDDDDESNFDSDPNDDVDEESEDEIL